LGNATAMHIDIAYAERLAELTVQARVGWCIAAASLFLLCMSMLRFNKRYAARRKGAAYQSDRGRRFRDFHSENSATASMEYLLVLFPFLIIVMTVWQLAFMINAQMHVSYAAYAAARSASVMIAADYENEKEGLIKKEGDAGARKWERIRAAAIPGTLAISPGEFTSAVGVAGAYVLQHEGFGGMTALPDPVSITARLTLMTAHHTDPGIFSGTRLRRALVKNEYAERMTDVLINSVNRKNQLDLSSDGLSTMSSDTIEVTVKYVFWLHVPYVGRLMEAMFNDGIKNPVTGEYLLLNPFPSLLLSETVTMTSWPRNRVIKPCN